MRITRRPTSTSAPTATPSCTNGAVAELQYTRAITGQPTVTLQPWTDAATFAASTAGSVPGTHVYRVYARPRGTTGAGVSSPAKSVVVADSAPKCTLVKLTAPVAATTVSAGVTVPLNAQVTCPTGVTGEVRYQVTDNTVWTTLPGYYQTASSWAPPTAGRWSIRAQARAVSAYADYLTSAATVLTVNPAGMPSAAADTLATTQNIAATVDVVANDSDPDGPNSALGVASATSGAKGTVTFSGRTVTYLPAVDDYGADKFTYTVVDGSGCTSTATVTVTVTRITQVCTASLAASPTTVFNNQSIHLTAARSCPPARPSSSCGASRPAPLRTPGSRPTDRARRDVDLPRRRHRRVRLLVPPHRRHDLEQARLRRCGAQLDPTERGGWQLAAAAAGAQAAYQVATAATAAQSITVVDPNHTPLAVDDTDYLDEDSTISIPVLANDSDEDGDPLTVIAATPPAHGSISFASNSIVYTPAPDYVGSVGFTYTISDGRGGAATAAVYLYLTNVNDGPVAVADTIAIEPGDQILIDVLANDHDVDDTFNIASTTDPASGTVTTYGAMLLYTATSATAGSDSFTYEIGDSQGLSSTATVTVSAQVDRPDETVPSHAVLKPGVKRVSSGGVIVLPNQLLYASGRRRRRPGRARHGARPDDDPRPRA